jgi:hypothetical protein
MDNEKDAIEREQLPAGKILLRWSPEQGIDYTDELDYITQDMAAEYLVIERENANSGIIVYARYRRRTTWEANPTLRPLVRHLLRLAKGWEEIAKTNGDEHAKAMAYIHSRREPILLDMNAFSEEDRQELKRSMLAAIPNGRITVVSSLEETEPPSVEEFAQQMYQAQGSAPRIGQWEWDQLSEHDKETRRNQARWLLDRYNISAKGLGVATNDEPCDGCNKAPADCLGWVMGLSDAEQPCRQGEAS